MFIAALFNTEYMDIDLRIRWYIKMLNMCAKYNMPLITHEYLYLNFFNLQSKVEDRFFKEFNLSRIGQAEFEKIKQYLIEDNYFDTLQLEKGSKTATLLHLLENEDDILRNKLSDIIDNIQDEYNAENIEGIFHCLEPWMSLKRAATIKNIPLIAFTFSAIRKVHGYNDTLYIANTSGSIFGTEEAKKYYLQYTNSKIHGFENMTQQEILALLGKFKNLTLLPYIEYEPKYEVGVCTGAFRIVPEIFSKYKYTEDDIVSNVKQYYDKDKIRFRHHAYFLDEMDINRDKYRDDPVNWILSCKRLISVASQINLKAVLWNRISIFENKTNELYFLSDDQINSEEKIDIDRLNYFIFGYLVPEPFMFDIEYWRFRLSAQDYSSVYERHLRYYSNKSGLKIEEIYNKRKNNRLKDILQYRGVEDDLIQDIISECDCDEIDYNVLKSKIEIEFGNGKKNTMWRINRIKGDYIESRFKTNIEKINDLSELKVMFYPLEDVSGSVLIKSVKINQTKIDISENLYKDISKYQGIDIYSVINNKEYIIEEEFQDVMSISIEWKYK